MNLELTDEETALLEKELRKLLDNDRYFLSARCRTLRGMLDKSAPNRSANRSPSGSVTSRRAVADTEDVVRRSQTWGL